MSTGELPEDVVAYMEEKHVKVILEEAFHDILTELPEKPLEFLLKAFEKKTTLRLMVVGATGSGKQRQSSLLAEKYGAVLINAIDVFKSEIAKGTEEGKILESKLREGNEIPSGIAANLIIERVREGEAANKGWVLSGFPQTRSQALRLQEAGISPRLFILIDVPSEVAVKRCTERQSDTTTHDNHQIEDAPASPVMEVDPMNGSDNSLESIMRRWNFFEARKDELIECYKPFLVRIDGSRSTETVFNEICEQVDSRFVSV
ncbi:adenylate kinase [Trypanosoma theileri]|uniref:Adenylate kinase n=1 Tax=Trypanosoma theileri TaxID=67003 RepID=A0A1X0P0N7_9TRYP|nr:adenylate kinase [Trypanosoma theileri]ORC89980.1 adenylate kinase [Trypanosoma theileri]